MSLWDDYKADAMFERDFPFGLPSDEWVTKSGKKIELSDMTDAHIRNCMRMVGEDNEWYWRFQTELDRRK